MLALSLVPSLALADDSLVSAVQRRVEDGLLKPLAEKDKERSRFSRAMVPPQERRVRVTAAATTSDQGGRDYVPFAVDVRFGAEWRENHIVGCAYPKSGALFVKHGADFRPAEILLGKSVDPVAGVCAPARPRS